jgi:hypothetical protein
MLGRILRIIEVSGTEFSSDMSFDDNVMSSTDPAHAIGILSCLVLNLWHVFT